MKKARSVLLFLALASCREADLVGPAETAAPLGDSTADAVPAPRTVGLIRQDQDGTFKAGIPSQALDAVFDSEGISLRMKGHGLDLRFEAWGREGRQARASSAGPVLGACVDEASNDCVRQLEYVRPGLTEWWVNRPEGLEQGFTVPVRPEGTGDLVFEVATDGSPVLEGDSIRLTDSAGHPWTLNSAHAEDARGQELAMVMEVTGSTVRMVVDDEGAVYPIEVDPIWSTVNGTFVYSADFQNVDVYEAVTACDLDGDGYDDIAARNRPSSYGTFVETLVFRGSSTGMSTSIAYHISTGVFVSASYVNLFFEPVCAGDVNADGFDDLLVQQNQLTCTNGNFGTAVHVYYGSASGASTIPDATICPSNSLLYFAGYPFSVRAVGDITGDGYDDILIGDAFDPTNGNRAGSVGLYQGSRSGLRTIPSSTVYGASGSQVGLSVAAGDVNGDGYAEIVSAYGGGGYLFNGSSSGFSSTAVEVTNQLAGGDSGIFVSDFNRDGYGDVFSDTLLFNGTASGLTSPSIVNRAYASTSKTLPVGDINGDGFLDIGASNYSTSIRVFEGSASGFSLNYSEADLTSIHLLPTLSTDSGDIDGDGIDDIVITSCSSTYVAGVGSGLGVLYGNASDADGDGVTEQTDCDDSNQYTWPGAPEYCDDLDNDCDGIIDEEAVDAVFLYRDADGDSYGNPATPTIVCPPAASGYVSNATDCNDAVATAFPGGTEIVADGIDENCDGTETCYVDVDGDHYGVSTGATVTSVDGDCSDSGEGVSGDCDDTHATAFPGNTEVTGDGIDGNCDTRETCYLDMDGDGYRPDDTQTRSSGDTDCLDAGEAMLTAPVGDCNDANALYHPGATENSCSDTNDYNCDGSSALDDLDGDGYAACNECDDSDAAIHPGATEACNGFDDDCDGSTDEAGATGEPTWFLDADGDGFGLTISTISACNVPTGYVASAGDCDDAHTAAFPGGEEVCDSLDNDCDGTVDESSATDAGTWYLDADGDGYGASANVQSCTQPTGYVAMGTDCDDSDVSRNPGLTETVADGKDNDCDGIELCYPDVDADGWRTNEVITSADSDCADAGEVRSGIPSGDCDDGNAAYNPGVVETDCSDSHDYNCDGVSAAEDNDGDGYRGCDECDDLDALVNPGAGEQPGDETDQDCDGAEICYSDADHDGYRDDGGATVASTDTDCNDLGEKSVSDPADDCDDADYSVHPGTTEVPGDELDQDCDSTEQCYEDADNDGALANNPGTVASADLDCDDANEGLASDPTEDCDDNDPTVGPGMSEVVGDQVDQDCDGVETCYTDADGDDYRSDDTVISGDLDCTDAGEASLGTLDCDDDDAAINPEAIEITGDGTDQNCDGQEQCYADADGDGYRSPDALIASNDPGCTGAGLALASVAEDCDDGNGDVSPDGAEIINDGIDQDCDGGDLCYVDADGDGYRDPGGATVESSNLQCTEAGEHGGADDALDCDDADAFVNPEATDAPGDGIDQDCDGLDATASDDTGAKEPGKDCGCASTGSELGATWLLVLGAALIARKRR